MAEQNDYRSIASRKKIVECLENQITNLPQNVMLNIADLENSIFSRSQSKEEYMQNVQKIFNNINHAKNGNANMLQQQSNNLQQNINQNSMMLTRTITPMHHPQNNLIQQSQIHQNQMNNTMQQNMLNNTIQQNQLSNTLQQNMQNNNTASQLIHQNQLNNNTLQMGQNILSQNQQGQMNLGPNAGQLNQNSGSGQNIMLQQAGSNGQSMQMISNLQIVPNSIQHNLTNIGQNQTMLRAPMNPQQMSAMQQQQQPSRSSFSNYPPHQLPTRHISQQGRIQMMQQGVPINQMHNQQQISMLMSNQPSNQIIPNNQFVMSHGNQIARPPFNQTIAPGSAPSLTSQSGPTSFMINSPSGTNLQVPASPARLPVPSPGGSIQTLSNQGNVQMSTTEEQEYLQKWSQLQKYIEPLKRMIQQIDKDEDRKVDLNKMKNLLDILSDKTKRLPIQTLLKCEQVLEKQVDLNKQHIVPQPTSTSENFGESLLETLEANLKSPNFYHVLNKTFAPATHIIHTPSSPKRQKLIESRPEGNYEVNNLIQGEVARLNPRFSVSIHPTLHRTASQVIVLQCSIDDTNLPNVPPIVIILPACYPSKSPTFEMPVEQYDSTEFFSKIKENLLKETSKLSGNYSLTALLNFWDMSIRKSCRNS